MEQAALVSAALAYSLPLGLGLAAFGSAIGLGLAVAFAMGAIGRQPEASGKIMLVMVIGCAFIEALTLYAFVVCLMNQGSITSLLSATGAH